LLVFRSAELGALRERVIVEAFARAAERVTREGDRLIHEPGSDWFAVAMTAPARDGAWLSMLDARAALERMAAALSIVTGKPVERGWWPLESDDDIADLALTVERAVERGTRERERYEFLATVGHELRTPLTSIRGYLETLLDGGVDTATARRFLEVARSEALRLGRLVDGLLEFSALDLSAPAFGANTSLVAAVTRAVDALGPAADAARMRVEAVVDAAAVARIDGDLCVHALVNLLQNAIKYGRSGGIVSVVAERCAGLVLVHVDDDGPGVAPADRERIFERGVRVERSQEIPGSGLGLAIVRTIAERAGGSVGVTESPFGGARFSLALQSATAESALPAS
jgi:two-component system phosphate regulon sensor histidine kinase PhoR